MLQEATREGKLANIHIASLTPHVSQHYLVIIYYMIKQYYQVNFQLLAFIGGCVYQFVLVDLLSCLAFQSRPARVLQVA